MDEIGSNFWGHIARRYWVYCCLRCRESVGENCGVREEMVIFQLLFQQF